MTMKKTFGLALILSALAICGVPAQPGQPVRPARTIPLPQPLAIGGTTMVLNNQQDASELTTFNLDFPGGTARQLVDAIEKSMGKPVNVIVPDEYANAKLPPIKVTGVNLPQLFETLLEGSYKRSPSGSVISSYGFSTANGARQTDTAIWTFFVNTAGLTTFNINFPGGTPKELVAAIQKSTDKPLNVIVPPEFADTQLPPLKMNGVTVGQLFRALESASFRVDSYSTFPGAPQRTSGYGFRTEGNITDDSIWYFHVDKPPTSSEKVSRFYALAPYLESGLKVDDITTAVETAWKMLGEKSPPEISFHKDTKLLIAVGDPQKLQTIDSVLAALKPAAPMNPVLRTLMEKRQTLMEKRQGEGKTNE
jgi:hypothetical protein